MSQNDQVTESAIQAKGLNAPRVTPDRINELMGRTTYCYDVRPIGSTTTFAHAFLDGEFYLATGKSACVSKENFNAELGMSLAMKNAEVAAREKLWELEGYALRDRLASKSKDCPHAAPFRYCQICVADPCPIGLGKPATGG